MRFVGFNPVNAIAERLDEISITFGDVDVVGLIGTCRNGLGQAYTTVQAAKHTAITCGYNVKSQLSNKCCGVSILIGRKLRLNNCYRTFGPTRLSLRGRFGGILYRQHRHDFIFLCAYFPPWESTYGKQAVYRRTVDDLCDEIAKGLSGGNRSIRIISTDLNDQAGLVTTTDGWTLRPDETVGDNILQREGYATTRLRCVLEAYGMRLLNTYIDSGHTFYNIKGDGKTFDYFAVPFTCIAQCSLNNMLTAARRLQLVPDFKRRDHIPLHLCINIELDHSYDAEKEVFDEDGLALCATKGFCREELVNEIEAELNKVTENQLWAARRSATPTYLRRLIVEPMRKATLNISGRGKAVATPAYKNMEKERRSLLKMRRMLRMEMKDTRHEAWLEEIKTKLIQVTKDCRRMRCKYRDDLKTMHEEELKEALEQGDEHAAWKFMHRLSGISLGPRGITYGRHPARRILACEVVMEMGRAGKYKGLNSSRIYFD